MSATNRSDVRSVQDSYPTPRWVVHRLLELLYLPGGEWLEPAAGGGNIIKAVSEKRQDVRWTAIEKYDLYGNVCTFADFLNHDFQGKRFAATLTNPPYSLAMPFIKKAIEISDTVAMLLRVNFLGSAQRAEWMRNNTPSIYVLPNRPSFTATNGTDATEYAWLVWNNDRPQVHILGSTPKEERMQQKKEMFK